MNSTNTKNICWPCINCCKGTLVRVSPADIDRWKSEENYHTLLCIEEYPSGAKFLAHKKNEECIFLGNDMCTIYETRPEVCRRYPQSRQNAVYFDCKLKDTFPEEKIGIHAAFGKEKINEEINDSQNRTPKSTLENKNQK